MMPLFAILPFAYLCKITLGSVVHGISWILVYFVPLFALQMHFSADFGGLEALKFALCLALIDMIYANGYIQNDALTTKREVNPTLRLNGENLARVRENIDKIFALRGIIALVIWGAIYALDSHLAHYMLCGVVVLQVLYLNYNANRTLANLFLVVLLSYVRFWLPLLYILGFSIGNIIVLFFLYQCEKFLEFSAKKRYITARFAQKFIKNLDSFRVVYYAILALVFVILYVCGKIDGAFVVCAIYYFALRGVYFVALKQRAFLKYMKEKREKTNPNVKD